MVLGGDRWKHRVEALDVGTAVLGRKRDARNGYLGSTRLQHPHHGIQVTFCLRGRQPTQAIVAAKLHHDHLRMQAQHLVDAIQPILGCVAAHALIDDLVVVTLAVEHLLQHGRIRLVVLDSGARSKAVSETHQHGPAFGIPCGAAWRCGDASRGVRCSGSRLRAYVTAERAAGQCS